VLRLKHSDEYIPFEGVVAVAVAVAVVVVVVVVVFVVWCFVGRGW
jgi:hypothetical protein